MSDDAAWRELIAQYELPARPDATAPWPERENLDDPALGSRLPETGHLAADDPDITGETQSPEPDGAPGAGVPGASPADLGPPGAGDGRTPGAGSDRTRVVRHADPVWRPATDAAEDAGEDEDDHYIPPPPPPLPRLDSVAKGAWAALIGGPLYLLLATFLDWQVSGLAALVAVAAFVGGFAVMVFRMGDGRSRGDGPDDGAVV